MTAGSHAAVGSPSAAADSPKAEAAAGGASADGGSALADQGAAAAHADRAAVLGNIGIGLARLGRYQVHSLASGIRLLHLLCSFNALVFSQCLSTGCCKI